MSTLSNLFRKLAIVGLGIVAIAHPAQATTTVAKSQREALVFIANLSQGSAAQQAFYDFVEFSAKFLAVTTLGPQYSKITVVEGSAAKRAALSDKLDSITNKSTVKAVDLIFVTHGLTGSVKFTDTTVSMTTVKNDIIAKLTTAQRAKLRMVFSTACFGESHRARWIEAGFKTASGSKKIYADSAVSYLPFLVSWASGGTFANAVDAANAADVGNAVDLAASAVLFAAGSSSFDQVDSHRLRSGSTSLRISTMP